MSHMCPPSFDQPLIGLKALAQTLLDRKWPQFRRSFISGAIIGVNDKAELATALYFSNDDSSFPRGSQTTDKICFE